MDLKKNSPLYLSLLSGILLWAAWPMSPFTFLIFLAFIPLLYVSDIVQDRLQFFLYSFIAMLLWNAGTTWWIWNSTDVGSIAAIIANSLLMTLPWWGFRIFKRKFGTGTGNASLLLFWMSFEYIHLNWQLSWPWLTLGNVFALHPDWVQWYEFTGTSGGTLWILLVNLLLFNTWKKLKEKQEKKQNIIAIVCFLVLPFVFSFLIKSNIQVIDAASEKNNVIIVQPNIDPYAKFDYSDAPAQVNQLIALSEKALDENTKLVLWPETALPVSVWQNETENTPLYNPVFDFVKRHPAVTLETGIETRKDYGQEKATSTAMLNERDQRYFDVFNAAVAIHKGDPLEFYNKSKLVPGVESTPGFLKWMGPLFEQFGGTAGGYGRSTESAVFGQRGQPYITAPIICYESIYGEYVATYVRKGANLLTIITNDGWWKNTPGHQQHLQYARLRAIETRRWVARSANTGISAVIDEKGAILQTLGWDQTGFIKYNVPVLNHKTFYVLYGDILSKAALFLAILLVCWNIISMIRKKII